MRMNIFLEMCVVYFNQKENRLVCFLLSLQLEFDESECPLYLTLDIA